ncbi:MAG: porin family protein [Bacteroidales bacterium]
MRKLLILLSAVLFFNATNAQFIRFGFKAGVSSSNVKFDDIKNIESTDGLKEYAIKQGDSKMGFHAGFYGRIQLLGLFIQPELLFTHSEGEVQLADVTASKIYTETQKFNKVDIPVIVGWKLGPARIGLGPVASFMLSDSDGLKDKLSDLTQETTDNKFKNATFGYQIGVGLDILKKVTLDIRYEGNFSKLGNGITLGDTNYKFDQRNPQFLFSAGIFF